MGNQDNTRTRDQDIRRQPPQQEQAADKSAKKRDKQGRQDQADQDGRQASENDRMSRH
ncbi:MAG: hypothetical protein WDN01_15605 [Rhizomicrobium sp.]